MRGGSAFFLHSSYTILWFVMYSMSIAMEFASMNNLSYKPYYYVTEWINMDTNNINSLRSKDVKGR
jgi:hypothetical protein